MSKKKIYRREFLNPEKGTATICFDEDILEITDCRRWTQLEFWDPGSLKEVEDQEYKISMLIEVAMEYRRYLRQRNRKLIKENEWT